MNCNTCMYSVLCNLPKKPVHLWCIKLQRYILVLRTNDNLCEHYERDIVYLMNDLQR